MKNDPMISENFTEERGLASIRKIFEQLAAEGYNTFETFSLACLAAAVAGRAVKMPDAGVLEAVEASLKMVRRMQGIQ